MTTKTKKQTTKATDTKTPATVKAPKRKSPADLLRDPWRGLIFYAGTGPKGAGAGNKAPNLFAVNDGVGTSVISKGSAHAIIVRSEGILDEEDIDPGQDFSHVMGLAPGGTAASLAMLRGWCRQIAGPIHPHGVCVQNCANSSILHEPPSIFRAGKEFSGRLCGIRINRLYLAWLLDFLDYEPGGKDEIRIGTFGMQTKEGRGIYIDRGIVRLVLAGMFDPQPEEMPSFGAAS